MSGDEDERERDDVKANHLGVYVSRTNERESLNQLVLGFIVPPSSSRMQNVQGGRALVEYVARI